MADELSSDMHACSSQRHAVATAFELCSYFFCVPANAAVKPSPMNKAPVP